MRIALDTQSTLGRKTGIGQYTLKLLDALRRVAPEHEYLELTWGQEVAMRTDRRLRWQQWELPRRARTARADLLHVTGFDAPRWKPCPVVYTVHDLIGVLFPRNLPPISRLYWSWWLPRTVRWADAIVADSECTRLDIQRLLGVPAYRIEVVPLGVDDRFQPQSAEVVEKCRARYGLPADVLLYVGTIEPRKGVDTLVDAFAQLAPCLPHQLVVAGKRGWYWAPILARIAAHGLEERVRLLDYVPDEDLPALFSAASAFAFPSRYEGFGLPVIEAMACGTPVVCSDSSSLPGIAGDAALLVPPDDAGALAAALATVLQDGARADDLRGRGLERAKQFTWEKTAKATLAVYQRAARAGRGP